MKALVKEVISRHHVTADTGEATVDVHVPVNNRTPGVGDEIEIAPEEEGVEAGRHWHKATLKVAPPVEPKLPPVDGGGEGETGDEEEAAPDGASAEAPHRGGGKRSKK